MSRAQDVVLLEGSEKELVAAFSKELKYLKSIREKDRSLVAEGAVSMLAGGGAYTLKAGKKCWVLLLRKNAEVRENMMRDFVLFHEKVHCSGALPKLKDVGDSYESLFKEEVVADIIAASMVMVLHGEEGVRFVKDFSKNRRKSAAEGDDIHDSSPWLDAMILSGERFVNRQSAEMFWQNEKFRVSARSGKHGD